MRYLDFSIALSLSLLPLTAQTDQRTSSTTKEETSHRPEASTIPSEETDSPFGLELSDMQTMPEMPNNIQITNDGILKFDSTTGTYQLDGHVVVVGDNGLTLKADRAIIHAKNKTATLTGNVSVLQKAITDDSGKIIPGLQLFASHALFDSEKKTVTLDGNVSIYQGPSLSRCNHAVYYYNTRKLDTRALGSKLGPIILESGRFQIEEINGKTVFIGHDAGVTTHDVSSPDYWIRAKKTTFYPNDRIVFENLKLYAGNTPILWFPYLSQPLNEDLGLHIIPGARSNWGVYLLNSYGIMLGGEKNKKTGEVKNAWLLSKWHLDLRSSRGIAGGLDLFDTRFDNNSNMGWLKLYYLNDQNPTLRRTREHRSNINANRWKFELKHRVELYRNDDSYTYADFNIMALSDRYYLEDLEPGTYKINPNPNNEIGIFHHTPKYLLGVYTRLRTNDFYQSDTRLPEIFLDQIRGPIFNTPILHEGQTTLGIYKEYLADFHKKNLKNELNALPPFDPRRESIASQLEETGYSRFHTWQEFSLPINVDGAITVVPRVGLGVTSYWDIQDQSDSLTRTHFSAGFDASMKFSRVYSGIKNKSFGVDQLLHVIQPYANFTQLSTNNLDSYLNGIDTLTPSTRPLPPEVGRFPATDSLSNWSILRLGTRNTLLTKRDGESLQWLTLDTYINVFLNDLQSNRALSNLYNDLTWRPLPWMRLDIETQFPIDTDPYNFSEFSGSFTFMPNDSTELQLGYRSLNNHPTLNNTHRLDLRTYFRINNSWGIGSYHRYEFIDNTLEIQQYAIHHDFDSWRTSLGFLIRNNRGVKDEYGFMLNFTLKNFPSIRLPLSLDVE